MFCNTRNKFVFCTSTDISYTFFIKKLKNPKKIPNPGETFATIKRNNILRKFSDLLPSLNFMASNIVTKK